MSNFVRNRILEYIDYKGIEKSRFEKLSGLSNGFIDKVGESVRSTSLDKIRFSFPDLNTSWLLTGEGEMLKETEEKIKPIDSYSLDDYRLVPLINMDAVGGMGSINDVVLTESEYLIRYIAFSDAIEGDLCMPVSGNSMTPTCPPGSIVLVREVLDWNEYFGFGNIFVLLLKDGRRIIKEITRYDDNPKEYILCVSHNSMVPSEELPRKLISRVWKVIKILVNEGW